MNFYCGLYYFVYAGNLNNMVINKQLSMRRTVFRVYLVHLQHRGYTLKNYL